jgi:GNAT superfamily N-acetyltransferase
MDAPLNPDGGGRGHRPSRGIGEHSIEVRELTPALLEDYLAFFDGDAFVDNPRWASCYCYFNHAPHATEEWSSRSGEANRAAVTDMIARSAMHGWLAYLDGRVVGWCNASLRSHYTTLGDVGGSPVGAIVCFIVARPFRGRGVARALLAAACSGFERMGVEWVEAYPRKEVEGDAGNYHGPLRMYLSAGFEIAGEKDGVVTVRKRLADQRVG